MATDKDLEAKKEPETQEDAKKAPETGEPSIEYLVEGLTEEDLARVSGGAVVLPSMKCAPHQCGIVKACATLCGNQVCGQITCDAHNCNVFSMP